MTSCGDNGRNGRYRRGLTKSGYVTKWPERTEQFTLRMGLVTVLADGFAGNYQHINGNHALRITKGDVARGVLTIGKTHWFQYMQHPIQILNDWVHQSSGLNTFLTTRNGNLCITELYPKNWTGCLGGKNGYFSTKEVQV